MAKKLLDLLARNRTVPRARKGAPITAAGREATVYLYDAIVASQAEAEFWGGVAAETLVPDLRAIDVDVIHLRINSPGGDVFAAQAIAQALRDAKARVVAHVDGVAASAATVVATASDEIEMATGAMYMVHRAWTLAWGNVNDLLAVAELLEKVDGTLAAQYAKRTGASIEEMLAVMDAETWLTAKEAVDAKFVDRVSEEGGVVDANWDLSVYDHAPGPTAGAAPRHAAAEGNDGYVSDEHRARLEQRCSVAQVPLTVG